MVATVAAPTVVKEPEKPVEAEAEGWVLAEARGGALVDVLTRAGVGAGTGAQE